MSEQKNLHFPVEKDDFIDMKEIFPGIFAFRWWLNGRRHTKFFTDVFPEELARKGDEWAENGAREVTFEDAQGILADKG